MLTNVMAASELTGIASRKKSDHEFQSVRDALVDEEVAKGWAIDKKNKTSTRLKRQKAESVLLEDRVWYLLYQMGFSHLSGQGGANLLLNANDPKSPENQLDVVALDDDVALAIECKTATTPRKLNNFSGDLGKFIGLRERFNKAVRAQYFSEYKKPAIFFFWTNNIIVTENDRKRADDANVLLFDQLDLNYYEQLVMQIGKAARFQFLADVLKGRSIPGLELKVPAVRSKMGGVYAYTFSVSPEYLLKIAFVSHRARGKASDIDSYQRLLKKSRLKSIRQYITDNGIFPTNIVVNIANRSWINFDRGKQEDDASQTSLFGWLTIRPAFKVAWIIDGQHRLYAYADHEKAKKSLVSVMAFVGLEPSQQARLFIDINAEQRKVKQSLLQELYAELHWDAEEPEERLQFILSKAVQVLHAEVESPFFERIRKADDAKTPERCISFESLFGAIEKGGLFFAKIRKGEVEEYGPLWRKDNKSTLRRTVHLISSYFSAIKSEATEVWVKGSADGGGLAMNDGVTVCMNVLRDIIHHLDKPTRRLRDLDDDELVERIAPYAKDVGAYFSNQTADQLKQFRALRGVQGQTTGTRRVEVVLKAKHSSFDPPGLAEFIARTKAETTGEAFKIITDIEVLLQKHVLSELKAEYVTDAQDWWFIGVPKNVRKKVDDRINDESGKKGGREENFDLIDYREIATNNWSVFDKTLGKGKTGSKEVKTKWMVEVNELRKNVMHASKGQSLPITEDQLATLGEVHDWLLASIKGFREPEDV